MLRKQAVDYLVYGIVRVLICVVQAMRIETGKKLARWLAWLLGDLLHIRHRVVEENLRHAFPEKSEHERNLLARQMWNHLFLLVLEVIHAPRKIHETNWRRYITLLDGDRLVRVLLSERPSLIVTAHFGNFEVAGYVLGIMGFATFTVARTLDNPYIDRFLNEFRRKTGQSIIPKKGGYDQITDALASGGTMTLLADQYAGRKGCWIEFFDRPASAHKAIALLSMANEAPITICSARRWGEPLHIEMGCTAVADPIAPDNTLGTVKDITQWYTHELEQIIRVAPSQYWWLHRRWKDTRRPRRSRKQKMAA